MLTEELKTVSRAMPCLPEALLPGKMMSLEESGGEEVAALCRAYGDPGFLVPASLGGNAGSLLEVVQVLRFVGARCPSLAVMMTMHHHSVAAMAQGAIQLAAGESLLSRIVRDRALVASAFAEGRSGSEILESTVRCTRAPGTSSFTVDGEKKPCSMTHTADVALVGVRVDLEGGHGNRGLAVVDRRLEGNGSRDFWPTSILVSADSHCMVFDGVEVGDEFVMAPSEVGPAGSRDRLTVAHAEVALSCLFQLMVSAAYLGMATRLAELVMEGSGGQPAERLEILSQLQATALSVYRLADLLQQGHFSGYLLAQSMLVGHSARAHIEAATACSARALGGSGYLRSREAQYLMLASRCIDFHPPSAGERQRIVESFYADLA